MIAAITVPSDYDLARVIELTGQSPAAMIYREGVLEVDGIDQTVLDAALVAYTAEHDQRLVDNAGRQAVDAINRAAGIARQRYITISPGQELVYMAKERQAREYKAAGYTGATPEFVAGEATATGLSAQAAAGAIIAKADAWISIGAQIDQAKRTASVQIDAAKTAGDTAAITAARDTAIAAIEAL